MLTGMNLALEVNALHIGLNAGSDVDDRLVSPFKGLSDGFSIFDKIRIVFS